MSAEIIAFPKPTAQPDRTRRAALLLDTLAEDDEPEIYDDLGKPEDGLDLILAIIVDSHFFGPDHAREYVERFRAAGYSLRLTRPSPPVQECPR